MRTAHVAAAVAALMMLMPVTGIGQRSTGGATATLTALDHLDIHRLVAQYARAVVRCVNSGYDYADLYTADGWFAPTRDGTISNRWQGRERLAEAAGGGKAGCKQVAWNGVTHVLSNHVITAAP